MRQENIDLNYQQKTEDYLSLLTLLDHFQGLQILGVINNLVIGLDSEHSCNYRSI